MFHNSKVFGLLHTLNVYIVYTDTVTGEDSAYITLDVTSTKSFVMPGNNITVTTTEPDIKSTTDII